MTGTHTAGGGTSGTDLEEERDFLLRSLEDLEREREAGDLDEADYRSLRDSSTARAAAVLRAIEAGHAASPLTAAAPMPDGGAVSSGRSGARRWLRPAVVTGAVLGMALVAGALVARSAGERLPGEPATGSISPTGPSAGLQRARQLIGEGRTLEAIKAYDDVLRADPRQPEALAYRGWLLRLAGRAGGKPELIDKGMAFIERAVAADPSYPDAHFFRGLILFQDRRDPTGAAAEFRAFLANDPPQEMVPVVEDALRRALAAAPAPTG